MLNIQYSMLNRWAFGPPEGWRAYFWSDSSDFQEGRKVGGRKARNICSIFNIQCEIDRHLALQRAGEPTVGRRAHIFPKRLFFTGGLRFLRKPGGQRAKKVPIYGQRSCT